MSEGITRKLRPNASISTLSDEQRQQLIGWLLDGNMDYQAAQKMVAKEFKMKVVAGTLSRFYHRYCVPEILRRRQESVGMLHEFGDEAKRHPAGWDPLTLDALQQKAFELAVKPGSRPEDIRTLLTMVLRVKNYALCERKVEATEGLRKRAEDTTTDEKMTPEEKERRMREIFGMGPEWKGEQA